MYNINLKNKWQNKLSKWNELGVYTLNNIEQNE